MAQAEKMVVEKRAQENGQRGRFGKLKEPQFVIFRPGGLIRSRSAATAQQRAVRGKDPVKVYGQAAVHQGGLEHVVRHAIFWWHSTVA